MIGGLARTAARLGLHLYTYNSYQSLIRGGHTWLRLRLSEEKIDNHGDHLNVLVALNQDGIERHAREVEPGGAIVFNGARFNCDPSLVREGVTLVPLPVPELTAPLGKLLPVMQNTAALGALLHLIGLLRRMKPLCLALVVMCPARGGRLRGEKKGKENH